MATVFLWDPRVMRFSPLLETFLKNSFENEDLAFFVRTLKNTHDPPPHPPQNISTFYNLRITRKGYAYYYSTTHKFQKS